MLYQKELNVEDEMKNLENIKEFIIHNDVFVLYTKNLKTNESGCASFCNNKTIKVFEGLGDGSNDKVIDYDTFINNYEYYVAHEFEKNVPLHFTI